MSDKFQTDVLVIGGGGAAARAALEARLLGADVTLAVKGSFNAIGTRGSGATAGAISPFGVFATPGWTGPLSEAEKAFKNMIGVAPEKAYANIRQVGLGMADPKLVKIIVAEAIETRARLIELGSVFGEFGMRSHGVPIMAAIGSHIRRTGVRILERMMIVELLIQDGECCGAIGVDERTGKMVVCEAGAIVIATGGDANLYTENLNPSCNTGDGYAMGYRAGAELLNMEFKQIFLATMYPTKNMLIRTLPEYVKLTNGLGEEFLGRYLPEGASEKECLAQRNSRNPFSTRDDLSRYIDVAIISEVKAGRGTSHNGIYLDRTDPRNPALELQRHEFYQYRGVDFAKGPVEVGICHHSALGGFKIDGNGETTIGHLYAAGEVAAGPHGADRIGGGMLLASQVFGARAGKHGAIYAMGQSERKLDDKVIRLAEERIRALQSTTGTYNPAEMKKKLSDSAYYNMLVLRNEKNLNKLLSEVKELEEEILPSLSVTTTGDLVEALELQNMLIVAGIEANACMMRKESRGPHYRDDYPKQDDQEWLKSITIKNNNGSLELNTVVLDPNWDNIGDAMIGGYWA